MASGTARSGSDSFELSGKVTLMVCGSTTVNWLSFVIRPMPNCVVGKPPIETALSNDHFTSSAVTGVPSAKSASGFSFKTTDRPSGATSQLAASSPRNLL